MTTKLFLGDSMDLLKQMGNKSADIILTDVPYDFDEETKLKFHEQFLRISRGWIIVFSPPENPWILPANQYLFWIKPISTKNTSKRYSRFVEQIFVYGDGLWDNSRHWSQYTNVFTDLVDDSSKHPYRKPPTLITRLILNHTKISDIVLDPFMGSGSIGQVCKALQRDYIGVELDENYYRIAVENIG